MTLLDRQSIAGALERLGHLAHELDIHVELMAVGGAVMVLAYGARQSTHDVDVVVLAPRDMRIVRRLAAQVAAEREWPDSWLNDAAKGYVIGTSFGAELLSAPGIRVRAPSVSQLLAM